jgi:hypothetical protein
MEEFNDGGVKREHFPEGKAQIYGLTGEVLGEIKSVTSLLGQQPRTELVRLSKSGLDDEDIANTLTTDHQKVSSYAIYILKSLFNVSPINLKNKRHRSDENSDLVDRIEEKHLPEGLEGQDLIIYLTRFFFTRPLKREILARDFGISERELASKESKLMSRFKNLL